MNSESIENKTGPFVHTVFFWLKNPTQTSDREAFETAIRKLIQTNPQATSNHLGCPAESEKREVVDNSFTYCYVMLFPDLESQNAYQTDPTHLLFIEEASHLWERVVVYDSMSLIH
ncbi:MAG: Dabb family protein [Flavobacteriaceae bacterium]